MQLGLDLRWHGWLADWVKARVRLVDLATVWSLAFGDMDVQVRDLPGWFLCLVGGGRELRIPLQRCGLFPYSHEAVLNVRFWAREADISTTEFPTLFCFFTSGLAVTNVKKKNVCFFRGRRGENLPPKYFRAEVFPTKQSFHSVKMCCATTGRLYLNATSGIVIENQVGRGRGRGGGRVLSPTLLCPFTTGYNGTC